jgi:FAD/FMN-containing dehydrogenase
MTAAPSSAVPDPLPAERREHVSGWGGAISTESYVYRPTTVDDVRAVLELARTHGLTVGLRGAGRSYGDAALSTGNLCLDLSLMNRILGWDPEEGVMRVQPGVTIRQVWRHAIADGWWPAVVPGTMFTTVGGSAAMNIHGKNNWKVGPLGDHIREFELLLPSGRIEHCSRTEQPELFHAAIGSFGMLGCFTSLALELNRVHSGLLAVDPIPVPSLGAMIVAFEERLARADYLVGWVDGFATGAHLGRGLVHAARHLPPGEDPDPAGSLRVEAQDLSARLFGLLPASVAWRLIRPFTHRLGVRLVNTAHYHLARRHRRGYRDSHVGFAFLFDHVPDWQRALGPGGLIQHQSFVPAAKAREVFTAELRLAQQRGLVPYLGVLKRHRSDRFLMTHAVDGYSLALDFKVTRRNREALWALAAELDRLVIAAGGRFYLAKDSTLSPGTFAASLGEERLARFRALKEAYDPEGLLATDLSRRLLPPRAS